MLPAPIIQVIALGSPFGADRLAWQGLERLRQSGFAARYPEGRLRLDICPSPAQLPAMIIPGARLVLIDALEGLGQDEIRELSLAELERERVYASSHGLDLCTILPLIEQLYGVATDTRIIGIGTGDGALSALSPTQWLRLQEDLDRAVTGSC